MSEPTIDRAVGELSDEELVKAFELAVIGSTISFEAHISERDNTRAALLRRLAAATERPAAMPEPTPDRAVGEMSDLRTLPTDQLMTRFMYALNPNPLLSFSAWKDLQAELFRRIAAGRPDADAKLRLQLAATERPAETVTIRWDTAFRAYSWLAYLDETFLTDEDDTAIEELEAVVTADEHRAALSAVSDGGDCG